jgi:hypothetical protein
MPTYYTSDASPPAAESVESMTVPVYIRPPLTRVKSKPSSPRLRSLTERLPITVLLFSVGVVALLLLTAIPLAQTFGPTGVASGTGPSTAVSAPANVVSVVPTAPAALASTPVMGQSEGTPSATVSVANISEAKSLGWSFWGVNVAAEQKFTTTDAMNIANTPVTFIRFPGGIVGEEYNYTTGLITNVDGSTVQGTNISDFVTACDAIDCHAILQLPTEIDQPWTAAYYAYYVVHTLHFQPAYWELGNSVPGWTHFGTKWSQWGTRGGNAITPALFAAEVLTYVSAVKAVDSKAHFIALGVAMGVPDYAKTWVSEVALVDGSVLSGISVHSYTMNGPPSTPTWSGLLANLNGKYSLPEQVAADRSYMVAECPTCNLKLFVSEANGAEDSNYTTLLPTFAGELYIAGDTAQAINLRLTNLDWFCYDCNYGGAWETSVNAWQPQYKLFTQMMVNLGSKSLETKVTGPSTFYAASTYSSAGLALLFVNTNMTSKVSVKLSQTGILSGAQANQEQWVSTGNGPTNKSITIGSTLTIPALSITILTVAPNGIGEGVNFHPAHHHAKAAHGSAVPSVSHPVPPTSVPVSHAAPAQPSGGASTRDTSAGVVPLSFLSRENPTPALKGGE